MYPNKTHHKILHYSAIVSFWLMTMVSYGQADDTLIIDLTIEHQNISGFGGANIPDWIGDLNADQVDKAFGNEPGQIGLSILRIKVPRYTSGFAIQVPTAVRAWNLGAMIIASPWSPPESMKSNNNMVGGYLNPESYCLYADHLLGFAEFMESNGAPLFALSIQNEPDVTVTYESCDWTPEQMLAFIKEQGSRFDSVKVIVSESFHFDHSQTDPLLNDPMAEQYIDIIGGHIYGRGLSDYPLAREKGKEVWMTEHYTESEHSANDWPLALNVGTEIHRCMTANFSAYIWWFIRRFYALLGEDGNITKRGYVMSHYAKFIRPGYRRIGVSDSSVAGLDATAYKTDSTLVIVALNRNTDTVRVAFEILNGQADSLSIFATSAIRSVENVGVIKSDTGLFAVALEPESITTLTSFAGNAGAFMNIHPVAHAGEDQVLTDEDDTGGETVFFDGTGSNDPDGTITNYSWSLDDIQIGWTDTCSAYLSTGTHSVALTVTDNDGATHTDTVHITINQSGNPLPGNLWFEPECSVVGSNWDILADEETSNSFYVMAKPANEHLYNPSQSSEDHIVITFEITEVGIYRLWGRAKVPTADDDSFWLKMDEKGWILWNNISGGNSWQWDDVHDSNQGLEVVMYNLSAGTHTLTICHREDGTGLDKLFLTSGESVPSGVGGNAVGCQPNVYVHESSTEKRVMLYPNPAGDLLHIELEKLPVQEITLHLFNSVGLLLKERILESSETVMDISRLPGGIYLLRITTGNHEIHQERIIKM